MLFTFVVYIFTRLEGARRARSGISHRPIPQSRGRPTRAHARNSDRRTQRLHVDSRQRSGCGSSPIGGASIQRWRRRMANFHRKRDGRALNVVDMEELAHRKSRRRSRCKLFYSVVTKFYKFIRYNKHKFHALRIAVIMDLLSGVFSI